MLNPSTSRILQWIIPAHGGIPEFMKTELPGITAKNVGSRLRLTRQAMRMTQEEFGRRAGISKHAMSNIEAGRNYPTFLHAIGLSEAHDVPLDWICTGSTKGMRHELLDAIRALMALSPEPPPSKPPRHPYKVA